MVGHPCHSSLNSRRRIRRTQPQIVRPSVATKGTKPDRPTRAGHRIKSIARRGQEHRWPQGNCLRGELRVEFCEQRKVEFVHVIHGDLHPKAAGLREINFTAIDNLVGDTCFQVRSPGHAFRSRGGHRHLCQPGRGRRRSVLYSRSTLHLRGAPPPRLLKASISR
jgi:hypothetical protein